MTAPPEEIVRAARQVADLLRLNRTDLADMTPNTKVPQVQTNIGTFLYYSILDPRTQLPQTYTLIGCTHVPTSQQKVAIMEIMIRKIAEILGSPPETQFSVNDPAARATLAEAMDYHAITEPVTIAAQWDAVLLTR